MFVILMTILLGAGAGWIASLILNKNASQDWLGNIVVGILGAGLARFILNLLSGRAVTDFTILGPVDFFVAVLGAVLLLFIIVKIQERR